MPLRRASAAYLQQAVDLKDNPGQLAAYSSKGHCVVQAGPGSGKTKTLTLKLARILAEDVQAPQGAACITYSQECARELGRRLERLGLRETSNLFIGTVHAFCLRHLLMPYAELANLPVPYPITLATTRQSDQIFTRVREQLFSGRRPPKKLDMSRHRLVHHDRTSVDWRSEKDLTPLTDAYEAELRNAGLIDFDDLVIFGTTLVTEFDWVLPLLQARFPVLAVDEYQDLGVPLHRIVNRLAFDGGVRLFAVGDMDQSIYGFNGANGELLLELAERKDVERVRLEVNYRSADRIIQASELALGKVRGYRANEPGRPAVIAFKECPEGLQAQANHAVSEIIPRALKAKEGRQLGDIAILYRDYNIGNIVAKTATVVGLNFVRTDRAAPYKKCALTSWIEDCAAWCAGGWREGQPKLRGLIERWVSFRRARLGDKQMRAEGEHLTRFLWDHRTDGGSAGGFVEAIRTELVDMVATTEPSLSEQRDQVLRMGEAFGADGALAGLDLRSLGRRDGSPNHLNLLTLHSAKGCEYDVVIMLGLDLGTFPWRNEKPTALRESRRLFYVGLTRARDEVHMLYSGWANTPMGIERGGRSPFLNEIEGHMAKADAAEG